MAKTATIFVRVEPYKRQAYDSMAKAIGHTSLPEYVRALLDYELIRAKHLEYEGKANESVH